jgi:hypothetical protein
MKRISTLVRLSAALMVLVGGSASTVAAQTNLAQMVRSDVRADAQQITVVAMGLSEADAQKFWPIYAEYELARSQWVDTRLAMIRSYAENYETMSDVAAAELSTAAFDVLRSRLDLYSTYYDRFAAEVGAATALRWVQVERQLNLIIDIQFAQEVPLVFKTDTGS